MDNTCTFSDMNKNCNCILHCKKDDWYDVKEDGTKDWSRKQKEIKEFWKQIQDDLNNKYSCIQNNEIIDNYEVTYQSVIFPKFEQDYELDSTSHKSEEVSNFYFSKEEFEESNCVEKILIDNYACHLIENCSIKFINCSFLDDINLERYNFKVSIAFTDKCNFYGQILFRSELNCSLKLSNCNFHNNQELALNSRVFNKELIIQDCINITCLNLNSSECKSTMSLVNSIIEKSDFFASEFFELAIFINTKFKENIEFKYTTFHKLVLFEHTFFEKKLNLENTIFKDEANFLNIKNEAGKKLETENIENRETARIIKHSFEKQDNIIEANKFYALEMKKQEKELYWTKNFADKLIFTFHQISSNHSQNWLLPILWIFSVSFFYIGYIEIGELADKNISLMYIQIINFILLAFLIIKMPTLFKYIYLICIQLLFLQLMPFCNLKEIFNTIADKINPFSVMTSKDPMTFDLLLYKVTISYLIYQFIVSVRQNTRRK